MSCLRPVLLPRGVPLISSGRSGCTLSSSSLASHIEPLTRRTLRLLTSRSALPLNGSTPFTDERNERIEDRDIVTEASESYLSYAMSVIVGRALPDVRDGLKPVHRRILFGMHELNMTSNKPFKKCARVVGEVLGKYHPHGDVAVYNALVRMAQDFSMRYTLINGHGNFGSVDNDPPAAMRYTECKLRPMTSEMLLDHLEEDTVDFADTFDASHKEPTILPAKIPQLLINGSSGIAVGVATRIPPHNMTEIIRALNGLIQNPEISIEELMKIVPAPDFPTGGEILKTPSLKSIYQTGSGGVIIRGKVEIEGGNEPKGKKKRSHSSIIIKELPYLTNKVILKTPILSKAATFLQAQFVEDVSEMVENLTLEGISNIVDESDRDGMRVVIDLKSNAVSEIVLNNLYKHTALESRFSCNMVALVNGAPLVLNLKEFLSHFLSFRIEVITRRSKFQLQKATARLLIVDGLIRALENLEDIIQLLRQSPSVAQARQGIMDQFELDEDQAAAVASMPLSRLTIGEVEKLKEEQSTLESFTSKIKDLLASPDKMLKKVQKEADQLEKKFGDERKSVLVEDKGQLSEIDTIPNHPMIVTFSKKGYIKRMTPDEFSVQKRGGKGVYGAKMRGDDTMNEILHVSAHDQVLLFSNDGRVFSLRAYQIPQTSRTAIGSAIAQLLPGLQSAQVTSICSLGDKMDTEGTFLFFVTKNGIIKRTPVNHFDKIRSSGLIATRLAEYDELRFVQTGTEDSSVLIASDEGKVCRYNVDRLVPRSRSAMGQRGMTLPEGGEVVGMAVLPHGVESDNPEGLDEVPEERVFEEQSPSPSARLCMLMVTEKGKGKLVETKHFPARLKQGKGNIGIKLRKGDTLVKLMLVSPKSGPKELILASEQGLMTRFRADSIRKLSRMAHGVRVMNMNDGDRVTSVTTVMEAEEE